MIRPSLQEESDKLARSWLQHDAGMLRDYLVGGVEDPRLNVQSVLSRHFLTRALTGERFSALMEQEIRFGAAINCLTALVGTLRDAEELELILYALKRGADNAEGTEIPEFLVRTFAGLPTAADGLRSCLDTQSQGERPREPKHFRDGREVRAREDARPPGQPVLEQAPSVPNYIETFLSGTQVVGGQARPHEPSLNTFRDLWNGVLGTVNSPTPKLYESAGPVGNLLGGTPGRPAGGDA